MVARKALWSALLGFAAVPVLAASSIPVVESGNPGSTSAVASPASAARSASVVTPTVSQPVILLNQLDSLQNEVMEMRGLLEEQANLLDRIQKENRDRYLDLDRRISQLAGAGKPAAPVAPVKPSPAAASALQRETSRPAGGVDDNGDKLYQDTFQLIRDRRFKDAVAGLSQYLQLYPRGTYADNAQYWLGEVHLAQGELNEAEAAFSALVKTYPMSDKRPDATYKLGQVYDRLGERDKARQQLQMVLQNFPGSSAARLADVYLRNLES